MKKAYYLFNPGRLCRKDNSLKFTPLDKDGNEVGEAKYLPVVDVDNLYVFGSLDANSALFNFLGKSQINVHFFDYHDHYTGSFQAKEYLLSGRVLIAQAANYSDHSQRLFIAKKFIEGAAYNMLKNLRYYYHREKDTSSQIARINELAEGIESADNVEMLMGIEGNIRMTYYESFSSIIGTFEMGIRTKQPPSNEINAMISFVNTLCYSLCLDMIYRTQLNPTISFLHEPGERRYSLALDIAEIFKPLLADRLIFGLFNKKQIKENDFDKQLNGCLLKDKGRKTVVAAWDEKLKETIMHRDLCRKVSYKHLVKLECYKLVRHIMDLGTYEPFKTWW